MLLQERHLYQGVNLMDGSEGWVGPIHRAFEADRLTPRIGTSAVIAVSSPASFAQKYALYVAGFSWHFYVSSGAMLQIELDQPCAYLPPVDALCSECASLRTFSPSKVIGHELRSRGDKCNQSWVFSYACAKCANPLEFYLFRDGSNLKICGRFPIEVRDVCPEIPKDIREFISEASIAADTGNVLAGIFFLRVAVEQFFRSQAEVMKLCVGARPSGDELGAAYNSLIPLSLKTGIPSLKELYSKLSDAIHGAKEDRLLFDSAHRDIIKHFKARALFADDLDPS